MGFHIYTDGWWRKPENAVTTEATIVKLGKTKRLDGETLDYHAGYYQKVEADVLEPDQGNLVRGESGDRVYAGLQPFEVGQKIKVRWSAHRKTFALYDWRTAPEGESDGQAFGPASPGTLIAPGIASPSGAELTSDQAARVQAALGSLGLGNNVRIQAATTPASPAADPIAEIERLAALHKSGALTDEEFEQQKHRILGSGQ
jgi:hypothetical protein